MAVEVETSAGGPDLVGQDLGGAPVGDPAKDHDAFREPLSQRPFGEDRSDDLAEPDRHRKHGNADSERTPANAEIDR